MSRQASGLQAWFIQRLSALYLAGFLGYFLLTVLLGQPYDELAWQAWLNQPLMVLASLLFFLSLLLHTWVGVRDVIIDYVHPLPLRLLLLVVVQLLLLGYAFWVLRILL